MSAVDLQNVEDTIFAVKRVAESDTPGGLLLNEATAAAAIKTSDRCV